eukprot:3280803-Rhodomonas_salina.2
MDIYLGRGVDEGDFDIVQFRQSVRSAQPTPPSSNHHDFLRALRAFQSTSVEMFGTNSGIEV